MNKQSRIAKTIMQDQVFQNAFDHAAIGMVLSDVNGRCLRANRAFCEMVGYTEAQLKRLDFAALTHPDDLPQNLALGQRLVDGELDTLKYEKRYRHKHGHYVWGLLSASIMRDAAGQLQFIIAQIQDITEQKNAQEALRRGEANLNALLKALPDGLFQLSADGIILRAQSPLGQTLFVPEDQLVGKHYRELTPPALLPRLEQSLAEARQNGISNLHEIPVEVRGQMEYFELRISAIAGDGLLLILRKISDRVRAEQTVHEQRELAEALRDAAADLSGTLHPDELLDRLLVSVQRVVPHELATLLLLDQARTAHVARARGQSADVLAQQLASVRFPLLTTPYLHRMASTGLPLIIADVYDWPNWVVLPGLDWARACLGTPIVIKDEVIGFVNLYASAANFFTLEQADRLQAFARQAALALENARLFAVEREQADLAEALRDTASALNRTLDVDEVLDRILDNAGRVVPHDSATILLAEAGVARTARNRGYTDPALVEQIMARHYSIPDTPHLRQMAEEPHPLLIRDTQAFDGWADLPQANAVKSFVGAQIRFKRKLLGFLCLESHAPDFFQPELAAQLQVFANQAAVAIENARLYQLEQEQFQQWQQTQSTVAQTEKMSALGRLAASLAEEINRPLAVIHQHLEAAIESTNNGQRPAATGLEAARYEVEQINRTTRNVLDFAQPGTEPLQLARIDEALHRASEAVAKLLKQRHTQLTTDLGTTPPILLALEQLTQAVVNILLNAIEAAGERGQIHMVTRLEGEQVMTMIINDGPAIKPESLPHVGEPFFTTKSGHSGLGLAVCHQVAQRHGGTLVVENLTNDRGVVVTLRLPCAKS